MEVDNENFIELAVLDIILSIANSTKKRIINVGFQQRYMVDVERGLTVLLGQESVLNKTLMKECCL